jgi:hypothetical protein
VRLSLATEFPFCVSVMVRRAEMPSIILPGKASASGEPGYKTAPIRRGSSANIPRRSTIGTKRRLPRVIGLENPSKPVIAENGSQRGCAEIVVERCR